MFEEIPLLDIIKVHCLDDYRLEITFEDGVEGIVDIAEAISFDGVFEPLQDEDFFRQVKINPDTGTIEWPNGVDLDPVVLYARVTKQVFEVSSESANKEVLG